MKENAILLTGGILHRENAKTAHGLIRTSSRYTIVGVIDKAAAGQDAGYVIDKKERGIPVYATLEEFLSTGATGATCAVIGVAFPGGKLPAEMLDEVRKVIRAGISVVAGLHDYLSEMPELSALAAANNVQLTDIRKPRPKAELKFWTGEIFRVTVPVIAVLGTDCALGKRTTATMITDFMKSRGMNAHMVFTGQTGWLQGNKYGFILDSTYNDFISGELEYAIVSCYRQESPDLIFVEGQSALCNPSGPCGSEYLLSAGCKAVILQHAPARVYYNGHEATGIKISLKRELDLIRLYGSEVIAITLNTRGLKPEEALAYKAAYEQEYNIPVILPLEEGMADLAEAVLKYKAGFKHSAPVS